RKAITLKPNESGMHYNLGLALYFQQKLDEAVAAFRKAITLKPNHAGMYYTLGVALVEQQKLEEADAVYRKAIELRPDYAEAHCNLGLVLKRQGRFADALAALKRGHELSSRRKGRLFPSAQWVREAERLVHADARLPKILQGKAQPTDAAERI